MLKSLRKISGLLILIVSFTGIFLLVNSESVHAEIFESRINAPLTANGNGNDSNLYLKVDTQTNTAKINFVGTNENVFNSNSPNDLNYGIVYRNRIGNSIFDQGFRGSRRQEDFFNALGGASGMEVEIGGTIAFYRYMDDDAAKVTIYNKNGQVLRGLKRITVLLITTRGLIPINDSFAFLANDTGRTYPRAIAMKSFLGTGMTASTRIIAETNSYNGTTYTNFPALSDVSNDRVLNSTLEKIVENYMSISRYKVNSEKRLVESNNLTANSNSSLLFLNEQFENMEYGDIYRAYSDNPDNLVIYSGISQKKASRSENYYEYTNVTTGQMSGGLKELDFHKVEPKTVTLELGSDTSKQVVTNFSTVSSYSKLSSSFGGTLKSDTLGSYDLPITIRQPLEVNNNYLLHSINAKVTVVDTTKPTGTVKPNLSVAVNGTLALKDMFSTVTDNSGNANLKYSYVGNGLDTTTSGKQTVTVRVADPSGNYTDYSVSVEVTPGNFGLLSSDTLDFGTIKTGVTTKNIVLGTNQTVGITMEDLRGTKTGWRVQAKTSTFNPKSTTAGKTFSAGIKLPKGTVQTNGTTSTDLTTLDVTLNGSLQNVISAPSGKGMNKWMYSLGTTSNPVSLVNIPATVYVGDYQAILTWSMVDAPS